MPEKLGPPVVRLSRAEVAELAASAEQAAAECAAAGDAEAEGRCRRMAGHYRARLAPAGRALAMRPA